MALNPGKSGIRIKGFSLIEVVVAIAILSLLLGGMLTIFSQGFNAAKRTRNQAVAVNLARAAAEEYSSWGMANRTSGVYPLSDVNLNNVTYGRIIQISDGPVSPSQLKRLDTVISWPEGGTTKNLTVSTLKADY